MLELLRLLTQLRPRFRPLREAPFEAFAPWCLGQGLGPLVGYNLEYALPQLSAPRALREALLSVFQETLDGNALRLAGFRKAMQPLEGRKLVLLGALSWTEALYAHMGLRPLPEVSVLLAEEDVEAFAGYARGRGYTEEVPMPHGACGLADDGLVLGLYSRLPGVPRMPPQLLAQALPKRVFGPSVFSLGLEDNLLVLCARQYAEAYQGPWVDWVDMREAMLSLEVEASSLKAKALQWGIAHAVYASLTVLGRLFVGVDVQAFLPKVPAEWETHVHRWAEAFVALPEAVAQDRHALAREEAQRFFEEVASRAPMQ